MGRWRAAVAVLCLALSPHVADAGPVARVVSINTCTDQLLLQLADRRQIASITDYTADPDRSEMAREAAGLPVNHGLVEEILPLRPDLVLAGVYSNRTTKSLLRRLGYPVLELPVARDFNDIRRNIRTIATAIGHPERGEAAIATMDRQLALATDPHPGPAPVAAFFRPNSFTSGEDTLAHAVLTAAGFTNLAVRLGLPGTRRLPLEVLLASRPDVLVMDPPEGIGAQATEPLRHPALKILFEPEQIIRVPTSLWVCGTPLIVRAVTRLAERRRALSPPPAKAGS